MAASYLFVVVFLVLYGSCVNSLQTVNGRIRITIGTTAGCSDTVNFINDQLVEAYRLYGNFLDVEFVPWGRTTINNVGTKICQFGVNDCWANRLHRCVLNELRANQDAQVRYMQCEFSVPYPSFLQGSYRCALDAGLRIVDLDHCVANPGDALDRDAQAAAALPMQVINFVPSISFNGVNDVDAHNQARQRLASMICFALADDPTTGVTLCQI